MVIYRCRCVALHKPQSLCDLRVPHHSLTGINQFLCGEVAKSSQMEQWLQSPLAATCPTLGGLPQTQARWLSGRRPGEVGEGPGRRRDHFGTLGLRKAFWGRREAAPYRGSVFTGRVTAVQADNIRWQTSWCPARGWSCDRSGATSPQGCCTRNKLGQRLHQRAGVPGCPVSRESSRRPRVVFPGSAVCVLRECLRDDEAGVVGGWCWWRGPRQRSEPSH